MKATAVFDTPLFVVLLFHIIEWVRQTILVTVILVGVKWLPAYHLLTINLPFGILASLWGTAAGFGAEEACAKSQPGRAGFLQI